MIHSIELVNYQSHAHSRLDFHHGLNCIIGASDHGKSAIMRAFHSVIENRPNGLDMVSDWACDISATKDKVKRKDVVTRSITKGREMRITLINDSHKVERFRNDQNGYVVDGTRMEAIRMEVPALVSECLNIGEVNIQKQMDAPFLISQSGGDVARFINKMVNLEEIDSFLSAMDSFIKECRRDGVAEDKSIKEKQDGLAELTWIDRLQPMLAEIEALDVSIETGEDSVCSILSQLDQHEAGSFDIGNCSNFIKKMGSAVADLKKLDLQLSKLGAQFTIASTSLDAYGEAQDNLKRSEGLDALCALLANIKALDATLAKLPSADALQATLKEHGANVSLLAFDLEKLMLCSQAIKSLDGRIHSMSEQESVMRASLISYNIEVKNLAEQSTELAKLEKSRPKSCSACGRAYEHQTCGE